MADKSRYDNLSTIQILIAIRCTLSQYYQKVKRRGEEILDVIDFSAFPFEQCCPICHAPSCARFIGCYERQVIDEKGRYFQDFPVPRFLCMGKGTFKPPHQHKTFSLEIMIKHGILQFGKPDNLYCDNGAIFSTSHLQLACARLGIALIHSKPYDSPSRGKIERFFRTVRSKFMATLPITEINSLEQLK